MDNRFAERIALVLGDRKASPWGDALGFSRGTISRMMRGHLPGPEKLALISQAENASLHWLLYGRGRPFLATKAESDSELAAELRLHLEDAGWTVYLVTSPTRCALVLTTPTEILQAGMDEPVATTAVEVLAGPVGAETVGALMAYARDNEVWHLPADRRDVEALGAGRMGTFAIVGDERRPGLLSEAHPVDLNQVPDTVPPYGREALTKEEEALVEKFRLLTPGNRQHAWAVVDAFAHNPDGDGAASNGE